ncbi:P-loop containing nucleoside triphosphate hydrolase protein [Mucor lusitanicus]|uniref:P-loop containing nucleoside triphosphate hydrolase protein n=1 Tax=Mucor circinelloides f. lusitanicus TaxID=29924 RepID=A0A8H4BAA7_MUCCL|nr:P-loop containing nucleoside triphosphate hydrolase protein [Mucor lusitanicus]
MSNEEKRLEENLLKRSLLQQKKEECNAIIRDLGFLPDEAFEKYNNYKLEKLLRRLHRANEKLKKFSHVNKKASEQYGRFTKQREQLKARKTELDKTHESIGTLIDSLDRRKNEAIERTFHNVAGNFAKIFELLVPAGKGELVMRSDTQDMDVDGASSSSVDRYIGVSIKVSFNSKSDEGMIMQQLSGGQKSLVALALIFAIQRCDPAPFYLFDEIDANLDAQYRTAVADIIHKMSENAQFITTTFRPELLANADKFYGVTFYGKVSRIHAILKENALGFVEQESAR